jgi:hypothetical protein
MRRVGCLVVAAAVIAACGGSAPAAPETTAITSTTATPALTGLHFTVSPIDINSIVYITPVGAMAPWGHTLPTDHAYFYHYAGGGAAPPINVYAPAAGHVIAATDNSRIDIRVDAEYSYWLGPLTLAPGIVTGADVQPGTLLGTHATFPAFDFAVMKTTQALNFVNPLRYSPETLLCAGPMEYFEGTIRSAILAKVLRSGGQVDGKINYDVAGTLSGNWFAEDLAVAESGRGGEEYYGVRKLAFARDAYSPDRRRVSIGGLGLTGLYAVNEDSPEFTSVTASLGLVVYRLLNVGEPQSAPSTTQVGWLLVQLIDAGHLRVEAVGINSTLIVATGPAPTIFSQSAQIYLR